jgi:hypothetical protein
MREDFFHKFRRSDNGITQTLGISAAGSLPCHIDQMGKLCICDRGLKKTAHRPAFTQYLFQFHKKRSPLSFQK